RYAGTMLRMSPQEFEHIVADELDALPEEMVAGLSNIAFVIEDRPENGEDLLGLYEGYALTDRSDYGFGEMPDRIVLYRENLLDYCDTRERLTAEIHITLVHEIAHYYGIDDARLAELGWA
ncbi:MAG: metallopeptidase family protein, partial [Ancrocorticia sp.]|nr:metallopeptidase family protein [Ancrocorticia sp.]